jgi:hypothetical protein
VRGMPPSASPYLCRAVTKCRPGVAIFRQPPTKRLVGSAAGGVIATATQDALAGADAERALDPNAIRRSALSA